MLDYLADRSGHEQLAEAARLVEAAVEAGFAAGRIRPMEFGGDMDAWPVVTCSRS